MPDLISGNVLAKNFEYHAGATAAGVVMGLTVPVMLSSRSPVLRLSASPSRAGEHHRSPTLSGSPA